MALFRKKKKKKLPLIKHPYFSSLEKQSAQKGSGPNELIFDPKQDSFTSKQRVQGDGKGVVPFESWEVKFSQF